MVSTKSKEHLQEYINNYFVLLEKFYNINKLLINPDKSKLVIVCRPGIRDRVKDIKLRTSNFIIHQSEKVKILGMYISAGLTNLPTINYIISKVNYRTNVLKEIFRYSNYRTKKIITTSVIISIFRYGAPILIDSTALQLQKLQTLIMKISRPILGFISFKWSTVKIMNNLGW